MSRRKKTCIYTAVLLVFSFLFNVTPAVGFVRTGSTVIIETQRNTASKPHGPITINGDANFSATASAEGWSGVGSVQDPYIIENYDITLGITPEASINITNTQMHYIIRGCQLFGPAATPSYGIYLENSTNGQILDNIVTNFADGLYVIAGCNNLVVTKNNISYNSNSIHWDNSDNLTITQNLCSGNSFDSIHIWSSDVGRISGNNCSNNGIHGIYLENSDLHNLTENICNENIEDGIRIFISYENFLENNTSYENYFGIHTFMSDFNIITWNIFANNSFANGITDGITNTFQYNYWSDYTGSDANQDGYGDTSYMFSGGSDSSPLMYPPFPIEWEEAITDQHMEFGSQFMYSIAVYCPAPYDVWINNSMNFYLDEEVISSRITLPVGDYPLRANATNIYGYRTDAIFTVMVRDTTPPTITHPDDITVIEGNEGPQLEWTLSDLSSLTYSLLRNGTEISSSDVPTITVYFSTTLETYTPGVYNYTMVGVDIWGNVVTDTVLATILPIPFMEAMLPWLIVGVVGVVLVVVIVIIIRKTRK